MCFCTADGYARSEAVCVIFLQKARDAKRVYAKVVHAKTNCDGYKEEGISFPSRLLQTQLLEQFYEECCINPASVDFIEAHATGTKVSLLILSGYIMAFNDKLFGEFVMAALFKLIAVFSFQGLLANFDFWLVTTNLIYNSVSPLIKIHKD